MFVCMSAYMSTYTFAYSHSAVADTHDAYIYIYKYIGENLSHSDIYHAFVCSYVRTQTHAYVCINIVTNWSTCAA